MPIITQLPTTGSITPSSTFVLINDGATRRYSYQDLKDKLKTDGAVGYTGSTGTQGVIGFTGSTGTQGVRGYTGSTGTVGIGVPAGGSTGQALVKASNTNYDTSWSTLSGGGVLTTATNSAVGGVKIGSGVSITPDGTISVSGALTTATNSALGGVKIGSGVSITPDGTISVSAGGAYSRTTAAGTTTSIPDGSTNNISITGFKSYALLKIQTSAAAWVRLYTTSAARTSDSSRAKTTDPTPGSGVIAEVITSGAQTQLMTPGVFGFNDDGTPATTIYAAVANLSGSLAAITVTLTLLQLEA